MKLKSIPWVYDCKPYFLPVVYFIMLRDEVDSLMSELKAWAERAEHGAQTELARLLGVPKQRVNHWITGRKIPNLLDGLKLQAFLKKERRAQSRAER